MTDHVCAWAAASPARYRASSSSKAASMSSSVEHDDAPRSGRRRRSRRRRAPRCGTPRAAGRRPEKRTRLRTRRSPRVAMTVDVMFVTPTSAIARMFAISASRPCRTPAFTTRRRSSCEHVVGQHLGHGVPVAGREARLEALVHSACRVLQPRRRRLELVESGECGVEVGLVENFAAVDQVAFDRQDDRSPATRRRSPLARSHATTWVTTAPRSLSRCTASM